MMKIVFFGTPEYVLPILKAVHKKFVMGPGKSPIVAVVTQSPKPIGRKQILAYSAIDKWAHERELPIYYKWIDLIDRKVEADLGILAAYGEIIPKRVIELFTHGILVIHPSLLPKYRGASPIQATINNGDEITGVSIIKMDEKVDHGPIVSQFKEKILDSDTGGSLRDRLFARTGEVLVELIKPYLKGKVKPKEQNHEDATFTKLIKKEDGFIDLTKADPKKTERFVRAMLPWPGAWTKVMVNGQESMAKRLKILKAHLDISHQSLIIDEVQLEGKTPVSWKQFKEAYPGTNLN